MSENIVHSTANLYRNFYTICTCAVCWCCCVDGRHEGPVWQLAWAHPIYGSVLATCGYDRKVILWKEQDSGWNKIYEYSNHDSSGNHFNCCILLSVIAMLSVIMSIGTFSCNNIKQRRIISINYCLYVDPFCASVLLSVYCFCRWYNDVTSLTHI